MKNAMVGMTLLLSSWGVQAESQLTHTQPSVSARVTFAVVVAPVLHFDCAARNPPAAMAAHERWRSHCVKSVTATTASTMPFVSSPTPLSQPLVTLSWP